jgi:hypothetical protein
MVGLTAPKPTNMPNPQSVPAMTRSRPTMSANLPGALGHQARAGPGYGPVTRIGSL